MVQSRAAKLGAQPVVGKTQGAVTPSVHLGVPRSLSVTPGRGVGIRQQLGWNKVLWDRGLGDLGAKGRIQGLSVTLQS